MTGAEERERECVQNFLQIRKTELSGLISNFVQKCVRECDFLVALEFVLPVFGIKEALIAIRIIEQTGESVNELCETQIKESHLLFSVEPAGARAQSRVQSVKVVRRPNDKQPVVALQTVKLVQEERAVAVIDECIQILEHDYTRRQLPCLVKYFLHRPLFSHPA
jgi:hypothetical protein